MIAVLYLPHASWVELVLLISSVAAFAVHAYAIVDAFKIRDALRESTLAHDENAVVLSRVGCFTAIIRCSQMAIILLIGCMSVTLPPPPPGVFVVNANWPLSFEEQMVLVRGALVVVCWLSVLKEVVAVRARHSVSPYVMATSPVVLG